MKSRPKILMLMEVYYSENLHRGVAQYALEAGWSLNTSTYRGTALPDRRWDGIVGCLHKQRGQFDALIKSESSPAVSLTYTDRAVNVLPDEEAIGRMAAEHLLELGYRNFAFYYWHSSGYQKRAQALEGHLNPDIHTFTAINHSKTGRQRRQSMKARMGILRRALLKLPKPVAIMVPIDDAASEVMEMCEELGLDIPKNVGVLGVNNDELVCDFAPVPLSSVDDNEFKVGYEGAAVLDRIMHGEKVSGPILVPPKGVELRKSTDLLEIASVPDRNVAKAVRFIMENYQEQIGVNAVARESGLCRRALQDRFSRHMGRGLHDYILFRRIDHAKRLLRTTDLKTKFVAEDSGFKSREGFSRSFKQATGMSPAEYGHRESV